MTGKSLAKTIHLECLAFAITVLLAASDVGAEAPGSGDHTTETGGILSGGVTYNNHSACYDAK